MRLVPTDLRAAVDLGFATTRATTFRVNTLKAKPDAVLRDLAKAGVSCEVVKEIELAFRICDPPPSAPPLIRGVGGISSTPSYQNGHIYLQSLASQIPALVLAPQPGEKVLDMAAAPGGKTCQMAALMQNQGELLALEPNTIRFDRLKFNLQRQAATLVTALQISAEKLPKKYENYFDRVLLDAPCSSEGTFCLTDPESYQHWSLEFVAQSSRLQKRLIEKAATYLKPGGVLVYSTCALSPEENESVIDFALRHDHMSKVLPVKLKADFLRPALRTWEGCEFDKRVVSARRIYPTQYHEGFFVACLRK